MHVTTVDFNGLVSGLKDVLLNTGSSLATYTFGRNKENLMQISKAIEY